MYKQTYKKGTNNETGNQKTTFSIKCHLTKRANRTSLTQPLFY